DIDVFAPTGVRDDEHKKTNPEQLFAASYASCLDATLHHIAEAKNVDISKTEIEATIRAVQAEKGDLRFALDLDVKMPDVKREEADKILKEAYANCPISKATDGNMDVKLNLL
ncbi:MAG: OsmC family protein, partial [Cyclobacteriaceae bacterium]